MLGQQATVQRWPSFYALTVLWSRDTGRIVLADSDLCLDDVKQAPGRYDQNRRERHQVLSVGDSNSGALAGHDTLVEPFAVSSHAFASVLEP